MKNLLLTGGIFHPFDQSALTMASIFEEVGFESEITEDLEEGLSRLDRESFDMLTVYALRWTMQTGEKYKPYREQWALSLSEASRLALTDFVREGGALLAMHTAAICFDDWHEWSEIVGAKWVWGTSSHPPFGPVETLKEPLEHPITRGVESFHLEDEVYSRMQLTLDVEPLLSARAAEQEIAQPVLWARKFGKGRVVFDALGHDAAALRQETHSVIIQRSALWATGQL